MFCNITKNTRTVVVAKILINIWALMMTDTMYAGSLQLQPSLSSTDNIDDSQSYILGLFTGEPNTQFALGIVSNQTKKEYLMPFLHATSGKMICDTSKVPMMISLPPGDYTISYWITYNLPFKNVSEKLYFTKTTPQQSFSITNGKITYIGAFAGNESLTNVSDRYWTKFAINQYHVEYRELIDKLKTYYPQVNTNNIQPILNGNCIKPERILDSNQTIEATNGYVLGVFSGVPNNRFAFSLDNLDSKQEYVMPFYPDIENAEPMREPDKAVLISVPPGHYKITCWITYDGFFRNRFNRFPFEQQNLPKTFVVKGGEVSYIGSFAAGESQTNKGVEYSFHQYELEKSKLERSINASYPMVDFNKLVFQDDLFSQ